MLCSKFHCHKGFNPILFSCKIVRGGADREQLVDEGDVKLEAVERGQSFRLVQRRYSGPWSGGLPKAELQGRVEPFVCVSPLSLSLSLSLALVPRVPNPRPAIA